MTSSFALAHTHIHTYIKSSNEVMTASLPRFLAFSLGAPGVNNHSHLISSFKTVQDATRSLFDGCFSFPCFRSLASVLLVLSARCFSQFRPGYLHRHRRRNDIKYPQRCHEAANAIYQPTSMHATRLDRGAPPLSGRYFQYRGGVDRVVRGGGGQSCHLQ